VKFTPTRARALTAIIAALVLPFALATKQYLLFVLGVVYINVLLATGMNLLYGYVGLMPLMFAGLAGISAYTSVNLVMKLGWSFWPAATAGAFSAAVIGVLLGLPALRLRGFYFSLSSLVIQSAMTIMFDYLPAFTNGDVGISQIPRPRLFGTHLDDRAFTVLCALAAVLSIAAIATIVRSRLGAYLIAIREDDILAATLGINVTAYKSTAFFIASLIAGVGGALYAFYVGFISPRGFDTLTSLGIWLMVAFGGRGTLIGPVIGAVVLSALPYALQQFYYLKDIVYGLLVVAVILFVPSGVYGAITGRWKKA
jgi:branched-chain amino acid transport system permease protein